MAGPLLPEAVIQKILPNAKTLKNIAKRSNKSQE